MVEHLFDPPTTAKILNVKLPTIYTWVARRKIPFLKVGAALRFRPSALEAWLKEREHLPSRPEQGFGKHVVALETRPEEGGRPQ